MPHIYHICSCTLFQITPSCTDYRSFPAPRIFRDCLVAAPWELSPDVCLSYLSGMKHLDVIDGELAAVPVEERPTECIIGQNIELVILRLRSPDAEVWTANTATAAAAGLCSTKYQGYILLSNGLIQRTPCDCTLADEAISYIDEQLIDQLSAEGITITDSSSVRVATVFVRQSYTELACFRTFF